MILITHQHIGTYGRWLNDRLKKKYIWLKHNFHLITFTFPFHQPPESIHEKDIKLFCKQPSLTCSVNIYIGTSLISNWLD